MKPSEVTEGRADCSGKIDGPHSWSYEHDNESHCSKCGAIKNWITGKIKLGSGCLHSWGYEHDGVTNCSKCGATKNWETGEIMKPSEVTEEVSKPQAKKLQGMLDSLGQKVAKLGAPPSAKTKITQSLERFTDKLAAMKDTLDKKKAASEPKKETEPEKEEKNAEEPMKGKKKEPAKNEKEGKEAEPKPKEQKETASDKPDTNGDDKAPKGKVKDIGKGIYESETERMQSLRNIITEGLE